jgi:S1-C subfamily serine protease
MLGLQVQGITPAAVERYHLKRTTGVVVTGVSSEGDGARAGVEVGDVLLKINSVNIGTVADYSRAVAQLKQGGYAVIRVYRSSDGGVYTLSVGELGR